MGRRLEKNYFVVIISVLICNIFHPLYKLQLDYINFIISDKKLLNTV